MGCSNCKKKKLGLDSMRKDTKRVIETDKVVTWIIVTWILLGFYGLISLGLTLFKFIF